MSTYACFSGIASGGGKLELDDLLAPLAAQSSNLMSFKKSAKVLASSSRKLSAPLPQRTAERLDREAAYEQTKEEVDKWKSTMQRIRDVGIVSLPKAKLIPNDCDHVGRASELSTSGTICKQGFKS